MPIADPCLRIRARYAIPQLVLLTIPQTRQWVQEKAVVQTAIYRCVAMRARR